MKKISIIIPAYNSEKYLERCIKSIINQKYTNIEIILINDGSTDNTSEICEEFERNNTNVVYISKSNEGPGETRNKGIKMATGDYIGFVDADDYIHKDMYQTMMNEAEKSNSDIVQCGYYQENEKGIIFKEEKLVKKPFIIEGSQNCIIEYEKKQKINNFLCTKLFKKELFKGITIPPLYYAEDQCALTQLFYKCNKLLILPEAFYYYVVNPFSLYHSKFNTRQLDSIKAAKFMYDYHLTRLPSLSVFPSLKVCYYILKFYAPLKISKIKNKGELLKGMEIDFKYYYGKFDNTIALNYTSNKRKIMLKLSKISLRLTSFLFYVQRVLFNKK